jgi:hypothetical protein
LKKTVPMAENDQVIVTIAKNEREEIRVTIGEFNGRPIFGVRVWFEAADCSMRPGKAGIAFKVELLPEFAKAVAEAAARATA